MFSCSRPPYNSPDVLSSGSDLTVLRLQGFPPDLLRCPSRSPPFLNVNLGTVNFRSLDIIRTHRFLFIEGGEEIGKKTYKLGDWNLSPSFHILPLIFLFGDLGKGDDERLGSLSSFLT